ncbi:HTH-type transcriptional regulator BetI [Mycobacterium heckeshornense]|uniref:TetR/AcrR family transcriptional regulator n=1 Tax=Mycobacterium heckeshornense TaxID=110505 RepID=UPI0019437A4D|nr:TetR/AcrR family transcriptional regulator [Mycobacterium heckeshornense]BCQ07365.1 HTH-type transcriptional regulator BetI [Mycobacterium heckeshornense]
MTGTDPRSDKTVQKILAGAMKAISRQGTHKLSVSDICETSGVARGTFYRYFKSKDDVLAALARHFEDGVADAFAAAIAVNPDPALRVRVVLDTIIAYRATGMDFIRMLDVAPEFTLEFIRETFPQLVDAVTEALGPAAEEAPLVVSGALTKRELGELFLRSVMSMLFLPGGRSDDVPAMVASLFRIEQPAQSKQRRRRRSRAKAS